MGPSTMENMVKDEEWLDSRFMWKEELAEFVPGLNVEHEGRQESRIAEEF